MNTDERLRQVETELEAIKEYLDIETLVIMEEKEDEDEEWDNDDDEDGDWGEIDFDKVYQNGYNDGLTARIGKDKNCDHKWNAMERELNNNTE